MPALRRLVEGGVMAISPLQPILSRWRLTTEASEMAREYEVGPTQKISEL